MTKQEKLSDQAKIDAALRYFESMGSRGVSRPYRHGIALAAAYREQQEQLHLYREGYQGSCITCEPVALRNRELEEKLREAREALGFLLGKFKKIKEAPSRPTYYESAILRQDKLNNMRKVLDKIGEK